MHGRALRAAATILLILTLAVAFLPTASADVVASKRVSTIEVIRDNAGTSSTYYDDVFVLDVVDDDEAGIGDFVIASGDDRVRAGVPVDEDMDSLFGEDLEVNAFLVYADVDGSGAYSSSDWVFLSSSSTSLPSSSSSDMTDYSIRLTETDEGPAGVALRTTDDDRQDWSDDVSSNLGSGSSVGAFTWEDDNDDGALSDGEQAYFTPGPVSAGGGIPTNAIDVTWSGSSPAPTTTSSSSSSSSSTSNAPTVTTVTVTQTVTVATTVTVTEEGDGGDKGMIPGPAPVLVLALIAGLALLARRRLK